MEVDEREQQHHQDDDSSSTTTVSVRFVTKKLQFAVTETPVVVPAGFGRYGLSKIVNHLLSFDKPIPFDFLIGGRFLRTSLAKFLESNNTSAENVLEVEYVESIMPPKPVGSLRHDEWVASVRSSKEGWTITGSYDEKVRLWDRGQRCVAVMAGHTGPVHAIDWLSPLSDASGIAAERLVFVSASGDQSLRVWEMNMESGKGRELAECVGHTGSVQSVASSPDHRFFISGSWDATLKVWQTPSASGEVVKDDEFETRPGSKKRKTREPESNPLLKDPLVTLTGPTGAVSSLVWAVPETIYAAGWDKVVRIYDVESKVNVKNLVNDKVILSLSLHAGGNLLASGHTDNCVRIWDPRVEDGAVVKTKLLGHSGFVNSVRFQRTDSPLLLSGSHDGHVCVWDIRSTGNGPVFTIKDHDEGTKVLGVDWGGAGDALDGSGDSSHIVSGGEDGHVRIRKLDQTPRLEV